MSTKSTATIAGLSTFILLIAVALVFIFGQIVLLNGASESEGFNAISIAVICQSVSLLPSVILARWLTKLLITKFDWNKFLVVVAATIVGVGLGSVLMFLSIIVGTVTSGVR
ncbi:MAG TPA: hypothetical protein DCX53_15055 [Anaerolineae bacterium]|nr:hypothetical protein [Anaerolineae bacterium]